MKYIEELLSGDSFSIENNYFVVTSDYKQNKKDILRNCVNIKDGTFRWISGNTIVDLSPLYTISTSGDISPIKEDKIK